jgi:nucleoside 2-deoxyribosyltransferase
MKIYLAGPYTPEVRAALRHRAYYLDGSGIEVTNRWISTLWENDAEAADNDLADIEDADVFVLCADLGPSTRGGMWVELGFAAALDKPCYIVWRGGVAAQLPIFATGCTVVDSWESMDVELRRLRDLFKTESEVAR